MFKWFFSVLWFLILGSFLLLTGWIPAVISGVVWFTGILLLGLFFGMLSLAFWMVRSVFHLIGRLFCWY